jgi:hypothetical protein
MNNSEVLDNGIEEKQNKFFKYPILVCTLSFLTSIGFNLYFWAYRDGAAAIVVCSLMFVYLYGYIGLYVTRKWKGINNILSSFFLILFFTAIATLMAFFYLSLWMFLLFK